MGKARITAEPGQPFITIEREFEAPRNKVFAAMTDKNKLERWWVGPGYVTVVDQLDVRDGGSWKFIQTSDDGTIHRFHGCYHMVSPELTIQTFEYDGLDERGHVSLERTVLIEIGFGKTKLQTRSVFMSVEDRDALIRSGMEEGLQRSYDALDAILAEMP